MSRLIDKLTHIRQNEPQPIGFSLSRSAPEKPKMQLIARITAENLEKVSAGLNSADAALIEIAKADEINTLEQACQSKGEVPFGGWITTTNGSTLKKALNVACDFLVFPAAIPVSMTQKEKMGRVLELDSSLSETFLRTANDMPVDAVFATNKGEDTSLTIDRLMAIQRLAYLVSKPILVPISDNYSGAELQYIWDTGICGVIVELTDEKSAEKLAELRQAVEKLTQPAFRKKSRGTAILPRMQQPEPEKPEEGGEEEEE